MTVRPGRRRWTRSTITSRRRPRRRRRTRSRSRRRTSTAYRPPTSYRTAGPTFCPGPRPSRIRPPRRRRRRLRLPRRRRRRRSLPVGRPSRKWTTARTKWTRFGRIGMCMFNSIFTRPDRLGKLQLKIPFQ